MNNDSMERAHRCWPLLIQLGINVYSLVWWSFYVRVNPWWFKTNIYIQLHKGTPCPILLSPLKSPHPTWQWHTLQPVPNLSTDIYILMALLSRGEGHGGPVPRSICDNLREVFTIASETAVWAVGLTHADMQGAAYTSKSLFSCSVQMKALRGIFCQARKGCKWIKACNSASAHSAVDSSLPFPQEFNHLHASGGATPN